MDIEPRGIVEADEGVAEFGGSAVCLQSDSSLDAVLRRIPIWRHCCFGPSIPGRF